MFPSQNICWHIFISELWPGSGVWIWGKWRFVTKIPFWWKYLPVVIPLFLLRNTSLTLKRINNGIKSIFKLYNITSVAFRYLKTKYFPNKTPSLASRGGGARPREQMVSKCRTVGSSRPHPCQGGNILLKLKHFIFNFEVFQFLCRYNLDFFLKWLYSFINIIHIKTWIFWKFQHILMLSESETVSLNVTFNVNVCWEELSTTLTFDTNATILYMLFQGKTDSVNRKYKPKSARRVEIFNDTEYLRQASGEDEIEWGFR